MNTLTILSIALLVTVSTACSVNDNRNTAQGSNSAMGSFQKIETGRIAQIKQIFQGSDTNLADSANVGVSVGSHGHAGLYGSINAGKVLRALSARKQLFEITIKKTNGDFVAVTQPHGANFKVGDQVKILLRNGKAVVQH